MDSSDECQADGLIGVYPYSASKPRLRLRLLPRSWSPPQIFSGVKRGRAVALARRRLFVSSASSRYGGVDKVYSVVNAVYARILVYAYTAVSYSRLLVHFQQLGSCLMANKSGFAIALSQSVRHLRAPEVTVASERVGWRNFVRPYLGHLCL